MNMDNFTQVFIVTQKGQAYTTEGLAYLTKRIRTEIGINNNLDFVQGSILNKPSEMVRFLTEAPDSIVVLSHPEDIAMVSPKDNYKLVELLKEFPDKTCWDTWCKYALGLLNSNTPDS